MDKEKLINQIMKEAEEDGEPMTREEATEVAEMELKAKGMKNYTTSDEKVKKPREKKIDETKAEIIKILYNALTSSGYDATISNIDKEINFDCYTVNLIKHRPKKG